MLYRKNQTGPEPEPDVGRSDPGSRKVLGHFQVRPIFRNRAFSIIKQNRSFENKKSRSQGSGHVGFCVKIFVCTETFSQFSAVLERIESPWLAGFQR